MLSFICHLDLALVASKIKDVFWKSLMAKVLEQASQ